MKDIFMSLLGIVFYLFLTFAYFFGLYKVFTDEYKYSRADMGFALIIPFYPPYITAKEMYHLATVPEEDRIAINVCLEVTQDYLQMKKDTSVSSCHNDEIRNDLFKEISKLSKSQFE